MTKLRSSKDFNITKGIKILKTKVIQLSMTFFQNK